MKNNWDIGIIEAIKGLTKIVQKERDSSVLKDIEERLTSVEVKMAEYWNLVVTYNKRKEARLNGFGQNLSQYQLST